MLTRAALKNPYAVFAVCMIALILGAVSYKKKWIMRLQTRFWKEKSNDVIQSCWT